MSALLAGISLDTKNFTQNAGVRSFESAGWLKRQGADTKEVNKFFKMRLDFFQKKVNMIASAELMGNGIAVAYTKENDPAMSMLTGQTADELLEMRGVRASFVAGVQGTQTTVSARSDGSINVQVIMEKMGGGGHLNIAAAQSTDSPEKVIAQIVQILRDEGLIER
jgi:c-di-AMP phosphodiesterase-like protein